MLTLLIVGTLAVAFNVRPARASGTTYIRPDGSVDPPTAPIGRDGDIYTFTDNIYGLISVEKSNIVVDGNGYTLQGSGSGEGFVLAGMHNVTIKHANIEDFEYGISAQDSYYNTVSGNNIGGGIRLAYSSSNTLSGNNITGSGISLYIASNNTVSGNKITGGGISAAKGCYYNTVSENNITGSGIGIDVQYNSIENVISGNLIKDSFDRGIWVDGAGRNDIFGNYIENCGGDGIVVDFYLTNSIVSRNTVVGNGGSGIVLYWVSTSNTVSENNIMANNGDGIVLNGSSNNSIIRNSLKNNGGSGIVLDALFDPYYFGNLYSENNTIVGNDIVTNGRSGIQLFGSSNNFIYHNNFDNINQVYSEDSVNFWDDSYPSGGNYWSDYTDVDFYSGPNQDLFGMDGIWDNPYIVDVDNRDQYPLVKPWPVIQVTADFDPDTLNLRSRGKLITAYIELPTRYDINNIDVSTIILNDTFGVDFTASLQIGDYDIDGILDLMAKFDRAQLQSYIYNVLGIKYGSVTLKITGRLLDGTPFEGTADIFVNYAGDVNNDGKIDVLDAATVSAHWSGPPTGPLDYSANADLNSDGVIDIVDSGIVGSNWGQPVP